MKTVEVTTHLNADPDRVWEAANTSRLLLFVVKPMMHFIPVKPKVLPELWEEGDYLLRMKWFGIVPFGRQVISVSRPPPQGPVRMLRDNGHGTLIRRWDHLISIGPEGDGTRYTDKIEIDAGFLTQLVSAFARKFYAHRQERWHALVKADFDYDKVSVR